MSYRTADIERFLRITSERPIKRSDIFYAKEHRHSSDARKELVNTRTSIIDHLKERGIIEETFEGCKLTEYGSSLQKLLEEKHKENASDIELIPVMLRSGKISYGVRYRVGKEFKRENPKTLDINVSEEYSRLLHENSRSDFKKVFETLKKTGRPLKRLKDGVDFLRIETELPFYRTQEEIERLEKIARGVGMNVSQDRSSSSETEIHYCFSSGEKTPITIISRKSGKGFYSCKPLEIKVDLNHITILTPEQIRVIIEKLWKKD